jgi:hypothetical protein
MRACQRSGITEPDNFFIVDDQDIGFFDHFEYLAFTV